MQLRAAVAQPAFEAVAGQTLAVNTDQHRLVLHRDDAVNFDADAALAQGEMRLRIDERAKSDQIELAMLGRQAHGQLAADKPFALPAIGDQLLDRAQLDAVLCAELT